MPARKPMRKKVSVRARLAPRGRGSGILINKLPKDLVERIKREGHFREGRKGDVGYVYNHALNTIFRQNLKYRYQPAIIEYKPHHTLFTKKLYSRRVGPIYYFDAKTGQRLTSAQVMNRMKRKGIASL